MIPLKSQEDLKALKISGLIVAKILSDLRRRIKPGITTQELDAAVEEMLKSHDAMPAFKGYRGYPASVCVSINEEIVHGIPGIKVIEEGDIVSIDLGVNYRGFYADAAFTVPVGQISSAAKRLIDTAKNALSEGIKKACEGNRLFDISYAIQNYVEKNGFSVVRQFVGHGIGRSLHEEPEIPNFGVKDQGPLLKAGMVFAIEPMVNMGSWECRIMENGWTAVTMDGQPSAHFEHTVAITRDGPQILTRE